MITRPSFLPVATLSFRQKPVGLRLTLFGSLIGGLMIWACSGEGTTTSPGEQQQPPAVASVAVTPGTATLVSFGETAQLTASAQDANGTAISGKTFTWSSSDESIATVNSSGLVSAVAAGLATITATSEGKSGTAAITVLEPVASVAVSPDNATIVAGETVQLTATTLDAAGNELTGPTVTWSSSDEAMATVDATGLVTALGAGSATITATSGGKSGTAAITVPLSVLIDASRDGGAWWCCQAVTFDPDAPHQGKAFADHLRSLGINVRELPRPFTIDLELLELFDLVIRANEFGSYLASELSAYEQYVREGGNLLLLQDFVRPAETDILGAVFGLRFAGITRGSQLVNFVAHPITEGVASGQLRYGVGSGLRESPPEATILAHLDDGSYLDLNDNGIQDVDEPASPPVMGILEFQAGFILFIGDTNFLQGDTNFLQPVPQPLVDNILRVFLPSAFANP